MPQRKSPKGRGFTGRKSAYRAARSASTRSTTQRQHRLPEPDTLPDGTIRFFLKIGPKGRVLLPAEVRAAMSLNEGDLMIAWLKDGKVSVESHRDALRRIQEESRRRIGDRSMVDELIAERREAAARGE